MGTSQSSPCTPRRPNWGEHPPQSRRRRASMGSTQSRIKPRRPNWGESPAADLTSAVKRSLSRRKPHRVADVYQSLDQVIDALREAGLESSNLILGIDFTKSNTWTGKDCFYGQSLHDIGAHQPNPYEQAISILGRTLFNFDEDNLIPCFGFGDSLTHDRSVFSFYEDHRPCQGFDEVLTRYRQIVPNVKLAGPTSFAPVIQAAMRTVEESGGQYHVLVIIADGQVTRSVETRRGSFSPQEKATIDELVAASDYPLSIILVGVGDGPWDTMMEFDENIPARTFDNFHFVNFSELMGRNLVNTQKEALFALSALMYIPQQFRATVELELLGHTTGMELEVKIRPPPLAVLKADLHLAELSPRESSDGCSEEQRSRELGGDQLCPVCMFDRKDMAFGCGHQTCCHCGKDLKKCPICRKEVSTRIRLY